MSADNKTPWWFYPLAAWLPTVIVLRAMPKLGLVEESSLTHGLGSAAFAAIITLQILYYAWRQHRAKQGTEIKE